MYFLFCYQSRSQFLLEVRAGHFSVTVGKIINKPAIVVAYKVTVLKLVMYMSSLQTGVCADSDRATALLLKYQHFSSQVIRYRSVASVVTVAHILTRWTI